MADTSGYAPDPTFDDPTFDSSMGDLTSDLGSNISQWSYTPDWLDNIWGAISSPTAKNLLNIGSGIYGLSEASKMKDLASGTMRASDPFGPQRAQYAQQLQQLMADPSSITNDPGYQFQFDQGSQAVTRQMAAKGYLGSGNLGTALQEYGQNYAASAYKDRISTLASLAGANIAPNFGASLNGYASGIDLAGKSLASLGYGATMAGDQSTPSRPNSAGGEAATIGGIVKGVGGLASGLGATKTGSAIGNAGGVISGLAKGGVGGYGQAATSAAKLGQSLTGGSTASRVGATGPDASGIGYVTPTAGTSGINIDGAISTVGNAASIYSGIEEGGVGGYSKAVGGAASMAGYDIPYLGYVDAATKLAKGDTGGAGYSAMIYAAGPLAAVGAAIADAFNKGGDRDSNAVTAMLKSLTGSGTLTLVNPKNGVYKLSDGRYIQAGNSAKTLARTIANASSQEEATSAWNAWLGTASPDYKTAAKGG